jgi:hypothetical protein
MAVAPRQWSSLSLEEKINAFGGRNIQSMGEEDQRIYQSLLAQQWQQKPLEEKISAFEERGIENLSDRDKEIYDSLLLQRPVESQGLRMSAQGLTFGFADEIEAFVRSLGGGEGQTYEAIRDDIRNKLTRYKEQNPTEAITYETVGALAPTALSLLSGVGTGAGLANIARLTRTGTQAIPAVATLGGRVPRLAQGAATGAAYGGLYGVGTGEGTIEQRLSQARDFAGSGAAFGAGGQAILGVVRGTTKPFINLLSRAKDENGINNLSRDIRKMAKKSYQDLDNSGNGISTANLTNAYNSQYRNIVNKYGYNPDLPKVSSQLQDLTEQGLADFVSVIKNAENAGKLNVSLKELYDLKRRLNFRYGQSLSTAKQPALKDLVNSIDKLVDQSGDAGTLWRNSRDLWRTSSSFDRVKEAFERASRQVEAGVNRDAVSIYKATANNLLNKNNSSYFTSQEKALLKQFVKGNFVDNILQAIGTYAPSSGNFMRIVAVGGAFATNGLTLPITFLAQYAKTSSNRKIAQKAQELLRDVAMGNNQVQREFAAEFNKILPSNISGTASLSGKIAGPQSEAEE